jgi:hypothetical protein
MGTRSETIIYDGNHVVAQVYRQHDGYLSGHGLDLAKLCDKTIVNGIGRETNKIANGMGDLAAQVILGLKKDHKVGGIYMTAPTGDVGDWTEYVYVVRHNEADKQPTIEVYTNASGAYPFNRQSESEMIFRGSPKELIARAKQKQKEEA